MGRMIRYLKTDIRYIVYRYSHVFVHSVGQAITQRYDVTKLNLRRPAPTSSPQNRLEAAS